MHRALWPGRYSGGPFPGLAPFPCVTGPSWPRSCLIPQQIIQSSLVPCVWDTSHHSPSPCPAWVMLGSGPRGGVGRKGRDKEAAACGQNSLSPCSDYLFASPHLGLFSFINSFLGGWQGIPGQHPSLGSCPPTCLLLSVPPQPLWHTTTLPSLSPAERAVAEVKSVSELFVNISGVHYCMCLYINSWRFTKLTLCPDEYNHI